MGCIVPNYLTFDELKQCQQAMIISPYKAYNGIVLNDAQVMAYNRYTQDLNDCRDKQTRAILLNNRHKYFCWCIGIIGM